jgi:hypothetical protein
VSIKKQTTTREERETWWWWGHGGGGFLRKRDCRRISHHSGIQKNVVRHGPICQMDKKCSGSPIRVHKVSTRNNDWSPRMNREPKKLYLIFDEYANILRGMYSTRFNGLPENKGDHAHMDTAPGGPSSPLITSCIITLYYIHLITHLAGGDHNPNPTLTYSGSDRTYQRDSIVGCIT